MRKKNWTILIYSDGNNELAPEMWAAKIKAEKIGSSDKINIIMQIGSESQFLVKIIRPSFDFQNGDFLTGVRRYYIEKPKSLLIEDLKKTNMAHPHTLYNFIFWGIKSYPSDHLMVILSGHGFSFVAAMTDLSQEAPYVMGISQMCKVINMVQKNTGVKIDILVLDMCYMNTIEVLYELGKSKNHSVNNILTYVKDGPIQGLPYDILLSAVEDNADNKDTSTILKTIVDKINLNLVSIKINHGKLKKAKKLLNNLAYSYLTTEDEKSIDPYTLLYNPNPTYSWYPKVIELKKNLNELILYSKNSSKNNLIDIVTEKMLLTNTEIGHYVLLYYQLSFSKNNYWLYILTNKSIGEKLFLNRINDSIKLEPIFLPPLAIPRNIRIMNPLLKEHDIQILSSKLFQYKKWEESEILNKVMIQDQNLQKES
jgi:hypothetical protein